MAFIRGLVRARSRSRSQRHRPESPAEMRRILRLSGAVLIGLLLALAWVRDPRNWPPEETTAYQGEAAEPSHTTHSPAALARLVREPQNAWSNLGFVLGGAFLLVHCRARAARGLGVALMSVGVGSFLYHASASTLLRQLDVGAMYWLFVLAGVYSVSVAWPPARRFAERNPRAIACAALMVAVLLAFMRNVTVGGLEPLSLTSSTATASAILALALALQVWRRENVAAALQFLVIVTLFGVAVYLQRADRPGRPLYRPDALIQAHALWHILAATAFTWAIMLSDRSADESPAFNCARLAPGTSRPGAVSSPRL
jgi:hypothetical protein